VATKLYVLQANNRHVIKRLDATSLPAVYDGTSFGTWGLPGSGTGALNSPRGLTSSATNIFIADTNNNRIVKLDLNLVYVGEYSTVSTVGQPHAIKYDTISGDLYIVGVYNNLYVRVERITTSLVSVKASGNLNAASTLWWMPNQIQLIWVANTLMITGNNLDTYLTTESISSFSSLVQQPIIGETTTWPDLFATTRYFGFYYDSGSQVVFLNNGRKLLRADETFTNTGDSDQISKDIRVIEQLWSNTLGIYNADAKKLVQYDYNLNYVADLFVGSGNVIATDAYDVTNMLYKII
jgi:hypothetical protein